MIRTERAHLKVSAASHPGRVRSINEDRYAVSAYRLSKKEAVPVLLAVLADGIGGHRAGEVAAELGVETVSRVVSESDGQHPLDALRQAVISASQQIFASAQKDDTLTGMGATCACALIQQDRLYTATVGDSRIYLYRAGRLRQVSTDHTWVQEAVERGLLTKEQATGHPNAHVIRRFMGAPTPPDVDLRLRLREGESDQSAAENQGVRLEAGDRLLLCSDGLTDLVPDGELAAALENPGLEQAVQYLVNLSLERGGHDNITLVGLEMPGKKEMAALLTPPLARRRRIAALGCAAVFLVGLAAGLYFSRDAWSGWLFPAAAPTGTATLPAELLTVIPGRTATTAPAYPPPFGTISPPAPAVTAGPTLTPWPTNTLPAGYP